MSQEPVHCGNDARLGEASPPTGLFPSSSLTDSFDDFLMGRIASTTAARTGARMEDQKGRSTPSHSRDTTVEDEVSGNEISGQTKYSTSSAVLVPYDSARNAHDDKGGNARPSTHNTTATNSQAIDLLVTNTPVDADRNLAVTEPSPTLTHHQHIDTAEAKGGAIKGSTSLAMDYHHYAPRKSVAGRTVENVGVVADVLMSKTKKGLAMAASALAHDTGAVVESYVSSAVKRASPLSTEGKNAATATAALGASSSSSSFVISVEKLRSHVDESSDDESDGMLDAADDADADLFEEIADDTRKNLGRGKSGGIPPGGVMKERFYIRDQLGRAYRLVKLSARPTVPSTAFAIAPDAGGAMAEQMTRDGGLAGAAGREDTAEEEGKVNVVFGERNGLTTNRHSPQSPPSQSTTTAQSSQTASVSVPAATARFVGTARERFESNKALARLPSFFSTSIPLFSPIVETYGLFATLALGVCYFFGKGLGSHMLASGALPIFKDVFKVSSTQYQAYTTLMDLGWSAKPIVGLLSDLVLFRGEHKRGWLSIAALLAVVCSFIFVLLPTPPSSAAGGSVTTENSSSSSSSYTNMATYAALCGFFISFGFATIDLLLEGYYCQLMQLSPSSSSMLVSWVWSGIMAGGIVAAALEGPIADHFNPKLCIVISGVAAMIVSVPIFKNWIGETRFRRFPALDTLTTDPAKGRADVDGLDRQLDTHRSCVEGGDFVEGEDHGRVEGSDVVVLVEFANVDDAYAFATRGGEKAGECGDTSRAVSGGAHSSRPTSLLSGDSKETTEAASPEQKALQDQAATENPTNMDNAGKGPAGGTQNGNVHGVDRQPEGSGDRNAQHGGKEREREKESGLVRRRERDLAREIGGADDKERNAKRQVVVSNRQRRGRRIPVVGNCLALLAWLLPKCVHAKLDSAYAKWRGMRRRSGIVVPLLGVVGGGGMGAGRAFSNSAAAGAPPRYSYLSMVERADSYSPSPLREQQGNIAVEDGDRGVEGSVRHDPLATRQSLMGKISARLRSCFFGDSRHGRRVSSTTLPLFSSLANESVEAGAADLPPSAFFIFLTSKASEHKRIVLYAALMGLTSISMALSTMSFSIAAAAAGEHGSTSLTQAERDAKILNGRIQLAFVAVSAITVLSVTSFFCLPRMIASANLFMCLKELLYVRIGGPMDYFYTATPECLVNGPHFSYSYYQSFTAIVGYAAGAVGVSIFYRFFSKKSIRWTFLVTTTVKICASIVDLILVNRWNITYLSHLPFPLSYVFSHDKGVYFFGDAIVFQAVQMLDFMPMVLLTSKMCPKGLECTTYAILAGFSNFGGVLSNTFGSLLIAFVFPVRTTKPSDWVSSPPLSSSSSSGGGGGGSQLATDALALNPQYPNGYCDFSNLSTLLAICHFVLPLFTIVLIPILLPSHRMDEDVLAGGSSTDASPPLTCTSSSSRPQEQDRTRTGSTTTTTTPEQSR